MANPDLEPRGEGGGFDLLALMAFPSSVISSFSFTQNKRGRAGPPGPSSRSASATEANESIADKKTAESAESMCAMKIPLKNKPHKMTFHHISRHFV